MSVLLENKKSTMEALGFWDETSKQSLMYSLECRYSDEILKEWCITDIIPNRSEFLFKWTKRLFPLSDEEVKEKYR